MNLHALFAGWEMRYIGAPVAAASNTDDNSARIDMAGYDAAAFVTGITDSVATGVAGLKVEENSADSDSGMVAVTGAAVTKTCAVNDDINSTLLAVEMVNPKERYIQAVRTSATANIAFGDLVVFLKPRILPPTQGATVSASTVLAR